MPIRAPRFQRRYARAATLFAGLALGLLTLARAVSAGPIEAAFHVTPATSTVTVDHAVWDGLLKTYVVAGADGLNRVEYARFKAQGQPTLKSYIARLIAIDPATLGRDEAYAFWANLYNAITVDCVLDHYPIASIKDLKLGGLLSTGPWSKKMVKVKGIDLSLDDIEHAILRPWFKDPMVHYAVNCASVGCPNLPREAFVGARLAAQLDAAARAFVNHPRGITVAGGNVRASKLYSWYGKDFGSEGQLLDHVRRYSRPEQAAALTGVTSIASYDYDWRLNDAPLKVTQ